MACLRLHQTSVAEMGHHFVPQKYLRGFATETNPRIIWMYDKVSGLSKEVPIKAVAQGANYFDAATEKALNDYVERPAQAALTKLSRQVVISGEERLQVALYIATMLMRAPRRRRKAHELIPGVLQGTVDEVRSAIAELRRHEGVNQDLVAARLRDVDRIYEAYQRDPPAEIIEQIRSPWPSERMFTAIHDMTWRIVSSPDKSSRLLTSDNPAHFFEWLGLGRSESELTFQLDSDSVLMGNWIGPRAGLLWVQAKGTLIREANRRTASGAERLLFYHADEDWVGRLSRKSSHRLNRLAW